MILAKYLEKLGDEKASELLGVKERTIKSWRRLERLPRPDQADVIVERSRGRVSYKDIYGPEARGMKKVEEHDMLA